ncbi:unnamed protein product [Plutella xylostella]|uniref:(diamondback moth) hypothetical protein n=1 Tax=Plutella xylostella TaxID=51655 RepID=A0A8S4DSE8_PLUXY|nr:unnamed protein product [Plutella xylostella]
MVVKKDNSSVTKYDFNRKAGKSIINRKPTFSPDGESVVVIVENVVRVYNIQTGDCSRILETEETVKELVSVQFPENDPYNLYGCSDGGQLTVWTWGNGAVLREMQLKLPAGMTVITCDMTDNNDCVVTAMKKNSKMLFLASFSMKTGEIIYEYKATNVPNNGILSTAIGVCDGDKYIALCNGTKCLFIQNLIQPHLRAEIINHNQLRILSVSAHPTESCVAIADTLGRITLIRGYLYSYANLSREVLHWHFLPPFATCFSQEGSYLLTGGMEKVLVKWTAGALASKQNEKSLLPRLPGMVRYIATNNSHTVLSLSNNSLVIVSGQLRVVTTILECGGLSPAARALGSALVFHRPMGALLLGGRTGHLQLFSTSTNKVLYNIDITQMNHIPPSRENLLPLEMEVTCAAVSADGAWLVTSEYRNDGVMFPEERLKFWALDTSGGSPFVLNTCVPLSHGGCQIVSLALNNKGDFCISAGLDTKFRVWKRTTDSHSKKVSWKCLTACYYSSGVGASLAHGILNNFKNSDFSEGKDAHTYMTDEKRGKEIVQKLMNIHKEDSLVDPKSLNSGVKRNDEYDMGGVAISQDGSLIAAWFGCKLTLWDTHACTLRTSLSHPAMRPKGLQVTFGHDDAAHYVVCTTQNCVAVWSLLSLTMKWLVPLQPSCLTADPFSNKIAVVTVTNDVFVFTPHSSTPLLAHKKLLTPETGVIKQCAFGAASGEDVRLYMMRNDSEIYCLEPEQSSDVQLEVISRRRLPASTFSALLAETRLSAVRARGAAELSHLDTDALGKTAIIQFLSGAPHMMPPVSLLSTSFLEHISGRQENKQTDEEQIQVMEVDGDSSEDDEPTQTTNGTYSPKKVELWTNNYDAVKEKRLKKIYKEPLLESQITLSLFGT